MRRSPFLAVAAALALAAPAAAQARDHAPPLPGQAELLARAVLPARTFAPGPASGTLLAPAPINGVPVPFAGQPVQGFSATLPAGHGRYWVMPDNGYGSIENSADFDLRVYLIEPRLETARGGPGTIAVKDFFELRDPGREIPFAIVNAFTRDRVSTFSSSQTARTSSSTSIESSPRPSPKSGRLSPISARSSVVAHTKSSSLVESASRAGLRGHRRGCAAFLLSSPISARGRDDRGILATRQR